MLKLSGEKTGISRVLLALVFFALSGCAWFGDSSGLYAVQDGDLQRLNGSPEWEAETWGERANLPGTVSFVVREPGLAPFRQSLDRVVYLRKVAWVRSEINEQGEVQPVQGSQWAETGIESLRVPLRYEPHGDDTGAVRVIPGSNLEPGLYSLQLNLPGTKLNARVGVGWPTIDRRNYAAAHCVDRYEGGEQRYQLCSPGKKTVATDPKWLRVHLVEPEIREMAGSQPVLIVRGVVVNTSENRSQVPPLEASLISDQGEVVKRWQFSTEASELPAGASARFHNEVVNPPVGISNVHVTFATPGTDELAYP